ncbi:hypothetical protein [Pseudomonas aeruginosa]|uniref:hypothetical protein n=1 Tax=Pseudomonas aeruginosa TaxID=287 RepID=UPI00345AC453
MSELNKESVEQADAYSCQGTNCGTTTGDHSSECLAEAAAGQGWELKPGDLCGRDCPIHKISVKQAGGDERAAFERAFTVQEGIYFDDKRGEYRSMNLRAIEATDAQDLNLRLQGWQARAALAQRSEFHQHLKECADEVATWPSYKREALTQPSPAQAEQAEGAQGERSGWGSLPIVQVPWNVFDRAVMWVEDRRRYGDDGTIVDDWKALKTIQRAALAQPSPKCATCNDSGQIVVSGPHYQGEFQPPEYETEPCDMCAQPSPAQADEKPGDSILCYGCFAKGVGPDHFDEAGKCLAAQAEQAEAEAEAERPEVVARVVHSNPIVLGQCGPLNANDELMTVAQHAASVARWAEMFNRVEQERDAALARVAELELKLDKSDYAYDNDRIHMRGLAARAIARAKVFDDGSDGADAESARSVVAILRELLAVGPAQAQHSVPDGYRLIRLEHFAAIKAQLNPEQVDAYRGRNIYDEDKVYANWNACRSALDEIKDVFQQIDWDAENELAELLAAAPGKEGV